MINFSALPSKGRVGRLLRLALRLVPRGAVMYVVQGPLRGARWIAGAATHGYWLGSYEAEKQGIFADVVRVGTTVIDVGANAGYYTLLASRLVGPSGCVVAVEPNPHNIAFLRRHLALNRSENVTVVAAAAGDRAGRVRFDAGPHRSMGRVSEDGDIDVEMLTLDSLRASLGGRRVSAVKIDVEGAEASVLRGAWELLAIDRPVVLLATHGDQVRATCLTFLHNHGYHVAPVIMGFSVDEADEFIARHCGDDRGHHVGRIG